MSHLEVEAFLKDACSEGEEKSNRHQAVISYAVVFRQWGL